MPSTEERDARLLMNLAGPITPFRFRRLIERFGSAAAALEASPAEWTDEEIPAPTALRLHAACRGALGKVDREKRRMGQAGVRLLTALDEEYPRGLSYFPDAPYVLGLRGRLLPRDHFAVAMVGTRRATDYGRAAARRLAGELARAGVTVVSGLARGIDTEAHRAALEAGGRTVGVMGSGFADFYPPENAGLAERMTGQGAVLSEFPLDAGPEAFHFPLRNRILSGMSLAVVVVEAPVKSGALITARIAAEQGRDVFAVPGSIFSEMSRGPHALLRDGARPVESAEDILEALAVFRGLLSPASKAADDVPPPEVSPGENGVLSLLSETPQSIDALAARCRLGAGALSSVLLALEIKGLARSLPGKNFVRSATVPAH
jgi:DNA processing protein